MKIRTRMFLILTCALVLAGFSPASLDSSINAIISRKSQSNADFTIKIIDADTGETVFTRNPNKPMIPASNMKLITSAAALHYLGSDFKYNTTVGLIGNNLVITGSGDPLLGDEITDKKYDRSKMWAIDDLIENLKKNQITSITDIIVDSTIFDDQLAHPSWPAEQLNREYACEISGLNFHRNCVDISVHNNNGQISVRLDPQTNYINYTNQVKSISSGSGAVGSYRTSRPNNLIIFGRCRTSQGPFAVAIERPATYFGYIVFERLTEAGIKVNGQLIEKYTPKTAAYKPITAWSTKITDCIERSNKDSLGLTAEALLKTIAAVRSPEKQGSWKAGQQLVSQYLQTFGLSADQFHIDDGSGLSRLNKLSPNVLTTVLYDIYKSPDWPLFKETLAIGGVDGTTARHFRDQKYRGRIFGKTGYINNVRTLSGYCETDSGNYIFSILTSGGSALTRTAINDIVKALFD